MQKTSGAICDELGDEAGMEAYVTEYGKTSLCSAATLDGCTDEEKKFIATYSAKSKEEVMSELQRLHKVSGKSMTSKAATWLRQRVAILTQLQDASASTTAANEL